jgi:hypothetical protein
MLSRISKLLALAMALAMGPSIALADTTYTYTSANYQSAVAPHTNSMHLQGSFTTAAPLPPSMPLTNIGPLGSGLVTTWQFNDGINSYNESNSMEYAGNPGSFAVSTDSSGNIATFRIGLMSPLPPHTDASVLDAFEAEYDGTTSELTIFYQEDCNTTSGTDICRGLPGTWGEITTHTFSRASSVISVPALSAFGMLLLLSLLVLSAFFTMRRKQI